MGTQDSEVRTQDSGEGQQQSSSCGLWIKLGWLMILGLVWTTQVWAYSGGTGEPNDPYQIATAADLIELGNDPNNYDRHFVLTADIDLNGYVFDRAVIAPDMEDGFNSGFQGAEFGGGFDGQGHIIHNLKLQWEGLREYLGLFGGCSSGAIISNLGLETVDVNGDGDYVGGLVGYNYYGSITSSYSTGSVSGGY